MKLESIRLRGYRCFDDGGQTIDLDDLTCFVGPNASGKTAAMMALVRMFGETRGQRQISPSDFYGESARALVPLKLPYCTAEATAQRGSVR